MTYLCKVKVGHGLGRRLSNERQTYLPPLLSITEDDHADRQDLL